MFVSFFYLLRARGLNVSLNEWMTFVEALDKGLFEANFTQFYYLSRSILVKSEADYDKYDRVFLEFFKDVEFDNEELSEELLKWLNNPALRNPGDRPLDKETLGLSDEKIRKMFEERLKEQKEEHNGGNYWIGTGGTSAFGNNGFSMNGIRVGGESRRRLAMHVAGERRFRDFRNDTVMDSRSFQMAFRSLRQFSSRVDAPRTELNIDETLKATCNNAGRLKLVFDKPRKNTVKLMLLIDSGGSMEMYSRLCTSLFQAASKSNHFRDLKVYYFHNCITDRVHKTPQIYGRDSVETDWILTNIDSEYKVIIVGDALMHMGELMDRGMYWRAASGPSGFERLRQFKERYPHLVWLNPTEENLREGGYWGQSYFVIKKEVDMYKLTVENLGAVMKKLMVAR